MSPERRRGALVFGLPLAYFAVRLSFALRDHGDTINPDAVAYLRNALYWTEGRFADAVSGYWSPLLSWCAGAGIALGFDPLHATYAALAAAGGSFVVLAGLAMRRLVEFPVWLESLAMLLVADATLAWSATAFPDLLLATALMGAIVVLGSRGFPSDRRLPVLLGICGGIGYLGKAYGFPFFLLWCPLSIAWIVRDRRRAVRAWLLAMLGFAIVAGPWIAALSFKYGRPTYGLVGGINRSIVGPEPVDARQMWHPVAGRVTLWETPEVLPYHEWSPFDSFDAMRHQLAYSWRTSKAVVASLARFDALGLALTLTLVAPFLAAALGTTEDARRLGWIAGTVVLYAAPFVLVYYTYRYTEPLLRPLCVLVSLQAARMLSRRLPWIPAATLLAGVLLSFAAHMNVPFRPHLVRETGVSPFNDVTVDAGPHRAAAARLRELGLDGPLASTMYWGGMYVAYFRDTPYVGSPDAPTAEGCDARLREHGARIFLVERGWPHAAAFAARPAWRLATTLTPATGETIDVYVSAAP